MASAAAFESFSIREYASKMRSLNVEKSWPFGGGEELKREEIEDLLPPIVCRKYRWWSHEVEKPKTPEKEEDSLPEFSKPETGRTDEVSGLEEVDLGEMKEEPTVMICPICGVFSSSTINAVNAHIDGCLAQASRKERKQMRIKKVKSKIPKKRSIVELFAVAPPIKSVEDGCDGEKNSDSDSEENAPPHTASKTSLKRIKKKKKELAEKTRKNQKAKKTKKKKKKIMKRNGGILSLLTQLDAEKGKIHKLKTPSADYMHILRCSLHNKRLVKDVVSLDGMRKEEVSKLKSSLKRNLTKTLQESKSAAKLQVVQPASPIHGILKNQSEDSALLKPSAEASLQGGSSTKHKQGRYSDKHVRFSGKDEFLGHREMMSSSIELPQMQNLCKVLSDLVVPPSMNDQVMETDKYVPSLKEAQVVIGSDEDVSVSIRDDGSECQSVQHEKCTTDLHGCDTPDTIVISRNMLCHNVGNTSTDESVDLNQVSPQSDSMHLYNPGSSNSLHEISGISKSPNYVPKVRIQAEQNVQRTFSTSRNLHDPFAYPVGRSAAMNSLPNMTREAASQPFLSRFLWNMEGSQKVPYLSPTRPNPNERSLQFELMNSLLLEESNSSMCFSMKGRKQQLSCKNGQFGESRLITDLCRDHCADEDFIGLPLNSQGELIQLHPNGKAILNQAFKKQDTTMASVGSSLIYDARPNSIINPSNNKDGLQHVTEIPSLKWLHEENHLENPMKAPVSSRLCLSALKDIGKRKGQAYEPVMNEKMSVQWLNSEPNLMNISCHGCSSYSQCHNHHARKEKDQGRENSDFGLQPIAQPTFRLMGKNVTIGQSNRDDQRFEEGKIWTDNEVIAECHPPFTVSDSCLLRQHYQQEQITHTVSGIAGNVKHSVEAQCSQTSPGILQMAVGQPPGISTAYYDCPSHLMSINDDHLIKGNHGLELPPLTQTLLNKKLKLSENYSSGSELVKTSHKMPIEASNYQNAYLHNMLLNSTQSEDTRSLTYGVTSDFAHSFSNHGSAGHSQSSCVKCSSLMLPQLLSSTQQKETSFSYHPQQSDPFPNHHPCFIPGTNLLPLPPPYITSMTSYPVHTLNCSDPSLQNQYSPISSARPSLTSSFSGFKPISVIKTGFRNRNKIIGTTQSISTCYEDHDNSQNAKKRYADVIDKCSESVKKPNLGTLDSNAVKGSNRRTELFGCGKKTIDAFLPINAIVKDELRTVSKDNSFNVDVAPRSGPIKLTAGTKHILKPSQNMGQDNPRPIHSTIPHAVVTDTGNVPNFQKKLAEIYRF